MSDNKEIELSNDLDVYSNEVMVTYGQNDFTLSFLLTGHGFAPKLQSVVRLSPNVAKHLAKLLQNSVGTYEEKLGSIVTHSADELRQIFDSIRDADTVEDDEPMDTAN